MARLFIICFLWACFTAVFAGAHPKIWVKGGFVKQSSLEFYSEVYDGDGIGLRFYTPDDVSLHLYTEAPSIDDYDHPDSFLFEVYPGYSGIVRVDYDDVTTHLVDTQCIFSLAVDKNLNGKMQLIQDGKRVHCKVQGQFADDSFKLIISDASS